ncbi:hypothetical protein FRC02_006146 [Tulasnella sp. 418]|nr:hypothetical protein FRC02_006146 [Tulasnella sp. 418]
MKYILAALLASNFVTAIPISISRRAVDPSLVPDLGFTKGLNPTGTGDCDGAIPGGPKIPCQCPPDRDVFIDALNQNVDAGFAVNNPTVKIDFPTDNSIRSQITRITASLITLQNLEGPGVGCPAVSTTLVAQQKALQEQLDSGNANPAPAPVVSSSSVPTPSSSAPAETSTSPSTVGEGIDPVVASLAPDLGFQSGLNPTGTGDCDGAIPGGPKIPCMCPPDQDTYLKSLSANVAAGQAVNNTSVRIDFPTDGSVQSQITRITAALTTLQNLRGPGVGCPAVSTTLLQQQQALQAELDNGSNVAQPSVPQSTTPSVATPTSSAVQSTETTSNPTSSVAALAPDLGFESGINPTGTGDCDGAVPGGPKIPCSCPPPRDEFIRQLEANVAAGVAVNNPTVRVSFPLDDSKESQRARIIASLITLQNLEGPGKGCPAVSTTLNSQLQALE